MPWVKTTDKRIFCGVCANVMEKYAIFNGKVVTYVAERCVTCRTQFNYNPKPDQVKYGIQPGTGDIKWVRQTGN